MKKQLYIEGMSCEHCVNHVSKALSKLTGVTKVEVDLAFKNAIIEASGEIDDNDVMAVIEDAGYEVTQINQL